MEDPTVNVATPVASLVTVPLAVPRPSVWSTTLSILSDPPVAVAKTLSAALATGVPLVLRSVAEMVGPGVAAGPLLLERANELSLADSPVGPSPVVDVGPFGLASPGALS